MKILVVGSGGREHAICWKIAQSKKVEKIYCAPGNAGIAEYAECVNIGAMELEKLADFAQEKQIDLTVIGMDDPLVAGVVDVFEARGLKVFGPRKNAAILEGSKAFSKDLMKKYNIPTAAYEVFNSPEATLAYLGTAKLPIVLKADGLALGKGVLICNRLMDAMDFEKAGEVIRHILETDSGIIELHRRLLLCELIFIEIIKGACKQQVDRLLDKKQRKFIKKMKNNPSVMRMDYFYALLCEKNSKRADKIKKRFDTVCKVYPYSSELESEKAMMSPDFIADVCKQ